MLEYEREREKLKTDHKRLANKPTEVRKKPSDMHAGESLSERI